MDACHVIRDPRRAELLLHPLRARILEEAREPASATEIGHRIGETPQKVNYHVTSLARAGFLRLHSEECHRNLVERRYQATARHYALSSEVLGPLGSPAGLLDAEGFSAARLLGMAALLQREVGEVMGEQRPHVPTISADAELRFRSPEERAGFADELAEFLTSLAARYGSGSMDEPRECTTAEDAPGETFRLVFGCYPLPRPGSALPGGRVTGPTDGSTS